VCITDFLPIINYFLVGWKARGLPKGGFGCGLAIKALRGMLYGTVMSSAKKNYEVIFLLERII
jgi:hypothetical protein